MAQSSNNLSVSGMKMPIHNTMQKYSSSKAAPPKSSVDVADIASMGVQINPISEKTMPAGPKPSMVSVDDTATCYTVQGQQSHQTIYMEQPKMLQMDRVGTSKALQTASFNLQQKNPIKPERLRNSHVSKAGFGTMLMKHVSQQQKEMNMINFQSNVNDVRRSLLKLHIESKEEQKWKLESQGQLFCHAYKDKEVDVEEEKKLHVRRTRESLPFGSNIKKAAFKATFGNGANHVLRRYATYTEKPSKNQRGSDLLDDLDELTDDSVSCSDSDSVSLGSVEVTEPGIPRKPSDASESTLKKIKSKHRVDKVDKQLSSMQEHKYLSGPINPHLQASLALPNFSDEQKKP